MFHVKFYDDGEAFNCKHNVNKNIMVYIINNTQQ